MKRISKVLLAFVCVTLLVVSCKKDYQRVSTEFIRNLPDTCEFLTQVENESEHLVYYKGINCNQFYCYNAEMDKVEEINCPKVEEGYGIPLRIGAGKENIMVGYMDEEVLSKGATIYSNACVQIYNLKTRSFKEFTTCNSIEFDNGKNQLLCLTFDTNKYGDGSRTDEIFDFDGKMLSKKEVEVSEFEEVPTGTLAAREEAEMEEERARQNNSFSNSNQTSQPRYYCELCGLDFYDVKTLLENNCTRNNFGRGHHVLYEGGEKSEYTCRYCGQQFPDIRLMVSNVCSRRGSGEKHVPAL